MITKQELSGKWKSISGTVKEKYGQITDDDFKRVEGDAQQLIGLIQQKTGQSREQVEAYFNRVCDEAETTVEHLSSVASEYAATAKESLREGYDQVAKRAQQGYEQSVDMIANRPMISVGTAFGIGLIAGIAVGLSMASTPRYEPTWRDRWTR